MRYLFYIVGLVLLLSAALNGWGSEPLPPADYPDRSFIQKLKAELPALDLSATSGELSSDAQTFFKAYGLYNENAQQFFGSFPSASNTIAAYVLVPDAPRGTVFCLHGYFDHFALLQHLVRRCLQQQYAVAGFDLPGHGLSSGEPNAVADFSDYVSVLDDFVRICRDKLPQPYALIGHSTGAAVSLEYMVTRPLQADLFKEFVLAAPLVRHRYYRLSRATLFLLKPFCESLPRRFHANSNDADFVERLRKDPLQGSRVPIAWLEALYRWNDRFAAYDPCARSVLMVQGTADRVVDWHYNIDLLEKKMTKGRAVLIDGARHQLFNEARPLREQVLHESLDFMER